MPGPLSCARNLTRWQIYDLVRYVALHVKLQVLTIYTITTLYAFTDVIVSSGLHFRAFSAKIPGFRNSGQAWTLSVRLSEDQCHGT